MSEKTTVRDLCRRAIALWGAENQWGQVVEECAELIVAVRHMQRGRNTVNQLADEIADVQIMLDQAALLVGPAIVEKHRKAKLERLERRIVEGERGRGRP